MYILCHYHLFLQSIPSIYTSLGKTVLFYVFICVTSVTKTSDRQNQDTFLPQVRLSGAEKELSVLRDTLSTLKTEKQSVESFASSLEKKWSTSESRRAQLEKEAQQLTADKEKLHTQVRRIQTEASLLIGSISVNVGLSLW